MSLVPDPRSYLLHSISTNNLLTYLSVKTSTTGTRNNWTIYKLTGYRRSVQYGNWLPVLVNTTVEDYGSSRRKGPFLFNDPRISIRGKGYGSLCIDSNRYERE